MKEYQYKIRCDHGHFTLFDDACLVDVQRLWDAVSEECFVVADSGLVSIRVKSNVHAQLQVTVGDDRLVELRQDIIALGECALDVPSGRIVIAGSSFGDAARLPLPAGLYRLRISIGSLDTVFGGLREKQNRYFLDLCHF